MLGGLFGVPLGLVQLRETLFEQRCGERNAASHDRNAQERLDLRDRGISHACRVEGASEIVGKAACTVRSRSIGLDVAAPELGDRIQRAMFRESDKRQSVVSIRLRHSPERGVSNVGVVLRKHRLCLVGAAEHRVGRGRREVRSRLSKTRAPDDGIHAQNVRGRSAE